MAKQKRITTAMAGKLIGVSPACIQQNMRNGNLPIGFYTGESGRDYFFISPIKLMMFTGVKKEAIERICEIDLSDFMDIEDWQIMNGALQEWKELVFGKTGVA
ncbi:hypothetical protein [Lacrimispora sp.]|uniref:hypothetical protein n=1 Tax=Lacrimispora sp. TaxID=2719234 RepID=UPI002FD9CB5F